jgi:long-chain acyl-CoA synthetase
MNVCDYLLGGKPADAVALLTLHGQHSYGELQAAARTIAAALVDLGGKKGDRAVLVSDNTFFWVAAYLGILRAGLVCVPLPPKLPSQDFEYVVSSTEPSFVFVESRLASALPLEVVSGQVVSDTPVVLPNNSVSLSLAELQVNGTPSGSLCTVGADDLAALMFTSGSTGKPRGVMVSHGNIIANTGSIIEYLSLTAGDRIMTVLPLHYCFGTSLLHTHLRVGGTVVLDPRFMYPEVVLQRMQETRCTGFAGVPSHFQILLRRSKLAKMEFPYLRYVQQAGGQLAPAFIVELRNALQGKQIFIMYGQTEGTARLSYLPPKFLDSKLGSIGKGIPGVRLTVVNHAGVPASPGETGEIVAEGDNIGLGYWRDEVETARCFRHGKLYTGDLATVDQDGFVYIVDRSKDFLKCGGKRVSCRYLENILLAHPSLLEAAVIGEPDEVLGEAAVAFVVARDPKAPTNIDQLITYCKEQLPLQLVPKRFVVLQSLPKNSSGKVLKTVLKSQQACAAGSSYS